MVNGFAYLGEVLAGTYRGRKIKEMVLVI